MIFWITAFKVLGDVVDPFSQQGYLCFCSTGIGFAATVCFKDIFFYRVDCCVCHYLNNFNLNVSRIVPECSRPYQDSLPERIVTVVIVFSVAYKLPVNELLRYSRILSDLQR